MELSLKLLTGRSAGQELKVPVSKFLIGRAEDCHLRPHSDLVSRHHCVLLVEEGFCAVRDFGSKNGTLVNEERVVGQRELHNGDRIKIGVLEFEIQLTSSVGGKKKPKVKDVKDAAVRTAAGSPPKKEEDEDISDWLSRRRRYEHRNPPRRSGPAEEGSQCQIGRHVGSGNDVHEIADRGNDHRQTDSIRACKETGTAETGGTKAGSATARARRATQRNAGQGIGGRQTAFWNQAGGRQAIRTEEQPRCGQRGAEKIIQRAKFVSVE